MAAVVAAAPVVGEFSALPCRKVRIGGEFVASLQPGGAYFIGGQHVTNPKRVLPRLVVAGNIARPGEDCSAGARHAETEVVYGPSGLAVRAGGEE